MPEGLSYRDFLDELLIACAVVVNRNTEVLIDTDRAINYIKKHFEKSWPMTAFRQLADDGLLHGSYTLREPSRYNLVGRGLARAEQLAEERGESLAALIEDCEFPEQPDSPVLGAEEETFHLLEKFGRLIRLSAKAVDLGEGIDETLNQLQRNNSLVAAEHAELFHYLANLEMGRELLRAKHAYQNLLYIFLLTSLRWIHPKVEHLGLKAQIQRLIDSTIEVIWGSDPI